MFFTLKFLKRLAVYDDVQPYRIYGHPELTPEEESNCEFEVIPDILAKDIREFQDTCCLDEEGFEVMNSPSHWAINAEIFEKKTSQSDEVIVGYLEETMAIVKKRFQASSVVTIDWRVINCFFGVSKKVLIEVG